MALARVFGGAAGPREFGDPAFYFYSARGEPDVKFIYSCARSLWVVSLVVESSPNAAIPYLASVLVSLYGAR